MTMERGKTSLMGMIKRLMIRRRAWAIRMEADAYFDGMVHHCSRVSANNNSLAYIVHRTGVFHAPKVEQIRRPDVVVMSENDSHVIVKDGYSYELRKAER